MTMTFYSGDRSYSSWSMRSGLLFDVFELPITSEFVSFAQDASVAEAAPGMHPSRTVPALALPDGTIVWDSLAIAEELASRFPEAGLWPGNPEDRAVARSICAEMHSSFVALRNDFPMNLRLRYQGLPVSDAVLTDLSRIEALWAAARARAKAHGPWLFGRYTIADAFFAPVAGRIAGYGLPVGADAQRYVETHLADPAFRRWRAHGLAEGEVLPWYRKQARELPWPGPTGLPAHPLESGTPINEACPFSGAQITHLAEIDGHVLGFGSALSRDKAVADAAVWPELAALITG